MLSIYPIVHSQFIPFLFTRSTTAVIQHLDSYEDSLWETPENVKQAILRLMSKRGLITDQNIDKVSIFLLFYVDYNFACAPNQGIKVRSVLIDLFYTL